MHDSPDEIRRLATATKAWNAPSIGAEHSAPALAISPPPFAVSFEVASRETPVVSRLNFGTAAARGRYVTWFPVTLTIAVVALDYDPAERTFVVTPTCGSIAAGDCAPRDNTITFTWTIPAGSPLSPCGSPISGAALDFDWQRTAGGRSKVVVTAISCSEVTGRGALAPGWSALPIDSSLLGTAEPATGSD